MGIAYTTTYTKITTVVTALFTAAVGVGIGLLCYYWVWCGMDKPTSTKIWIIVGFTVLGIIALLFDCLLTPSVWYLDQSDGTSSDVKHEVLIAILLLIFCAVIPGIMVIIDIIIIETRPGREERHWAKLGVRTSSGGYYGKKKAPDYDKDNDPAIRKTKTSDGGKKKVVFKNPGKSDAPAPSQGGKKKLVFNKPTKKDEKPAKKKLVYKSKKR